MPAVVGIPDEAALIARTRQRNQQAFALLYRRHELPHPARLRPAQLNPWPPKDAEGAKLPPPGKGMLPGAV